MRLRSVVLGIVLGLAADLGWAQSPQQAERDSLAGALRELQAQIRELQVSVRELRDEASRYRAETIELRNELARRTGVAPDAQAEKAQGATPAPGSQTQAKVEEDIQLLNDKVNEQYQTKVESASKYRVRLSGIALFNLFGNRGVVDNVDNPTLARARSGFDTGATLGGTLRQSLFGLEVFGPQVAGARTSADVQFDFAGGFPEDALNGVTFGIMRLRTARLRLQWTNTSLVGGQDTLFFAPRAPTSFASLSTPALSYAGNLWAWVPQLRVEHKVTLSEGSSVNFAAGILDGVTGEPPAEEYLRTAQAGEKPGLPAYATRVAWTHTALGRPLTIGGSAYYNRQNWGFGRTADGWAATSDFDVPLGRWFSVSGEVYRGRGIGGLGAGAGRSVVFSGALTDPRTRVLGLNSAGGWAQLKFAPAPKLEFNGALGQDNPFAEDLRAFPAIRSYYNSNVARNRGGFVNVIARPRSDLVLSVEYRRLRTFDLSGNSELANHINLSAGVLF